jgi:hypothetical protein
MISIIHSLFYPAIGLGLGIGTFSLATLYLNRNKNSFLYQKNLYLTTKIGNYLKTLIVKKSTPMLSSALYYIIDKLLTVKVHYDDNVKPIIEAYTPRFKNNKTIFMYNQTNGNLFRTTSKIINLEQLTNSNDINIINNYVCYELDEDIDLYIKYKFNHLNSIRISKNTDIHIQEDNILDLRNAALVPMDIQLIYNNNTYDIQEYLTKFYIVNYYFDRAFFVAFMNYFYNISIDFENDEFSLEIIDGLCNIKTLKSVFDNKNDKLLIIESKEEKDYDNEE